MRIQGNNNIAAARDVVIKKSHDDGMSEKLTEIDNAVQERHGLLFSAKENKEIPFSSRKLFASLASIDIPADVIYEICKFLPNIFQQTVEQRTQLATDHVRAAVMEAIYDLDSETLKKSLDDREQTANSYSAKHQIDDDVYDKSEAYIQALDDRKSEWARRYARRYGNPDQQTLVIYKDGSTRRLDFDFLKNDLVPAMLKKILNRDTALALSDKATDGKQVIISQMAIAGIAGIIFDELKRLNLYSLRYKTAFSLAMDLALQPPHPWFVTSTTQIATHQYDLERVETHLDHLENNLSQNFDMFWHHFVEFIRHSCSLVMGMYGGFLGHRHLSPISILKHWMAIRDENVALWEFCELREIEPDLIAIGSDANTFSHLIKKLESLLRARNPAYQEKYVRNSRAFFNIVQVIVSRRHQVKLLKEKLIQEAPLSYDDKLSICKNFLLAIPGVSKAKNIKDRRKGGEVVGFYCLQSISAPIFQGRRPMMLAIIPRAFNNDTIHAVLDLAQDLMRAHQASNTALLILDDTPNEHQMNQIKEYSDQIKDDFWIVPIKVTELRSLSTQDDPACELESLILNHLPNS